MANQHERLVKRFEFGFGDGWIVVGQQPGDSRTPPRRTETSPKSQPFPEPAEFRNEKFRQVESAFRCRPANAFHFVAGRRATVDDRPLTGGETASP